MNAHSNTKMLFGTYAGIAAVLAFHFLLSLTYPVWMSVPEEFQQEAQDLILLSAAPFALVFTIARHFKLTRTVPLFVLTCIYYGLLQAFIEAMVGQHLTCLGFELNISGKHRECLISDIALAGVESFGYWLIFVAPLLKRESASSLNSEPQND
jgi:hypothetical protein